MGTGFAERSEAALAAGAEASAGVAPGTQRDAAAVARCDGARSGADAMIELDHVSFAYKDSERGVCLDDVSLSIPRGQAVLLCGESGCGKTTVTRLINGLIPQFFEGDLWGRVLVGGIDVSEAPVADTAGSVGSVFQNPRSQFFNVDTTSELAFGCENLGWDVARIDRAVERVACDFGLADLLGRNLFRLSGGEKQRIACASVSASEPSVLVLDEPASNLDISTIATLARIIAAWKAAGKTVVVAEHRLAYLMGVVDRVVFMDAGRIVWDRPASEVEAMPIAELESCGLRSPRPVGFGVQAVGEDAKAAPSGGWRDVGEKGSLARRQGSQVPDGSGDWSPSRNGAVPSGSDGSPDALRDQYAEQGAALPAALEVEELSFAYPEADRGGEAAGVRIRGLELPRGAIVGVIGNNGAGKTTFSRCLCGLEKKARAVVRIAGEPCTATQRRRRCYLVMQDVNHQLFTESVIEEVLVGMRACGVGADEAERIERARAILESLDLLQFADVHPLALSGGQKQRVAIAGAIASEREIMVFDEPTSGLDLRHMLETAENLRSLSDRGATSLIVTHDPELIRACCDWVVSLSNGEVAWSSLLDEECAAKLEEFFG